jgi:peptide/nickel transport system substrate-binding protein
MRGKLLAVLAVLVVVVAACAAPTPEVIKEEVIVEKEVPVTVVVEKEKVVEKEVVQTVEVEKEVVVEKVVTATPKPGADKQGGTLVLGFYQEPELLNALIRTQTVASWAGDFLESGLVVAGPSGEYYAELAKEVPTVQNGGVSEDGLTITYHLREGVLWEDGDEFTCDDVKFGWEVVMNPDSGAVSTTGYQDIESVTCPDDYTVVVKFAKYYAPYLMLFDDDILPSHLGLDPAKMTEWEYNRKPLSLGPYKLEEWVSGDHMTLVRNENYYMWETEGKPYVDTVILRWIESREVGKQLIQTGELDFVWDLIEADIPEAQTWEGVVVSMPPSTGTERLLLNLRDPTLDAPCVDYLRENPSWHWALGDSRVREAIELGIDKQLIIDKLLYGLATVGTTEMNLGWGAPDIPESEFNPDKARTLLEEAGWTDTNGDGVRECHGCSYAEEGKVLKLKLQTTSGNALREQCEQVILEMMADIGIEMYIENVPSAELFGSYASGAFRKHGQFDILMFTTSYGTDPHSQMDGYYAPYNIPCDDNSGQGYNYSRWISDEYGAQMAIAGSSPDLAVRKAAYQKGSELIAEGRPHIYLYDRADIDLLRDHFKGYENNIWTSTGSWNAEEWYIEK